jgi:hypothetical protein
MDQARVQVEVDVGVGVQIKSGARLELGVRRKAKYQNIF